MDREIEHESQEAEGPDDAHPSPGRDRARIDANEQRDRLYQSGTEYFKAQYDFCKHFTTLSLASIAAVGAVAGGAFQNLLADYSLISGALVLGSLVGFTYSVSFSIGGMRLVQNVLWDMRRLDSEEAFNDLRESSGIQSRSQVIVNAYAGGLIAFLILVMIYGIYSMGVLEVLLGGSPESSATGSP